MFFYKAVITLALAVSALAMSIPRAINSTQGSYIEIASTTVRSEPSWLYGTQTGDATWYETGLGACGITNTNSDYIVAVSENLFDNYPGYTGGNPNNNPVCNKQITASYNGKSVKVTVTDRCTGCATTDLDFSPSAFQQLADLSVGRLHGMTWVWS
ncbi:plant expansin [Fomitopsis serialis]|uniref:plant expansin n=1 Tax=Fomitopsis serialis TaxID=139415 RepID=UPI002007F726|nr:plant expansin [Neoantrodia serialis]KAH9922488.1 plant expansin [Neoantrodia serialis]